MLRKMIGIVAMLPVTGMALGLGDIQLQSVLYQPLHAEIRLLDTESIKLEDITVNLASSEDFKRFGVERPEGLQKLQFHAERKGNELFVVVISSEPLNEPFLNFLLDVTWANGHLLRQYTILLDPPGYTQKLQTPAPSSTVAEKVTSPKKLPALAKITPPAQTYGPVRRADTLWDVGKAYRDQTVTVEQTMIAILIVNPTAFVDGNINRLKVGQTLTVPDVSQIQAISSDLAKREVVNQTKAWHAFRRSIRKDARVVLNPAIQSAFQSSAIAPQLANATALTAGKQYLPPVSDTTTPLVLRSSPVDPLEAADQSQLPRDITQRGFAPSAHAQWQSQIQQLEQQNQQLQRQLAEQQAALAVLQKKLVQQVLQSQGHSQADTTSARRRLLQPTSGTAIATTRGNREGEISHFAVWIFLGMMVGLIFLAWQYKVWRLPLFARLLRGWHVLLAKLFAKLLARARHTLPLSGGESVADVMESAAEVGLAGVSIDPLERAMVYLACGREMQAEALLLRSLETQSLRFELYVKLLEIYTGRGDRASFNAIISRIPDDLKRTQPVLWQQVRALYAATWPTSDEVSEVE